jgi:ABC-2 type transport system permease protein
MSAPATWPKTRPVESEGAVPRARKYVSLARLQVQQALSYRGATLLDVAGSLVSVAALYYLWRAVFSAQDHVGRIDWAEMQTYVLLSASLNGCVEATAQVSMVTAVRSGQITVDFLRPISFLRMQLAQTVGRVLVEGTIRSGATILVGPLLIHGSPPCSKLAGALFVASAFLALAVMFFINFLTAMFCFWIVDAKGLLWAQSAIVRAFSGMLVPLTLFPDWLRRLAEVLPFRSVSYTPVAIYLGMIRGPAVFTALGHQIVWLLILVALIHVLWPHGMRALVIHGG